LIFFVSYLVFDEVDIFRVFEGVRPASGASVQLEHIVSER
jgi:hypothetical protein